MGLSNIQWCDYTFNSHIGCTMAKTADGKPIEECFFCYAKTLDDNRFSKTMGGASKEHPISHWGNSAPRYRTSETNWKQPLKWNKKPWICDECGKAYAEPEGCVDGCYPKMTAMHRARVFCLSLGDWLDDKIPIKWLADLLKLIHDTPHLEWLLLTKRPQNWKSRLNEAAEYLSGETPIEWQDVLIWIDSWLANGHIPTNIWIGVSAGADQAAALEIPALVHFLSCEPMLRPLETTHAAKFDWIIFGGESGPKARECHVDWIRNGVGFCREHDVAPFVKQLGSNCAMGWDYLALKDSHGGDMEEWSPDLRVREFPTFQ